MSYIIKRSDLTSPDVIVDDQTISTQTSADLLGRNKIDYGLYVAQTFVHMLENFASDIAPRNPIPGQLWYDKTTKILNLNTSDTDTTPTWQSVSTITSDIGSPTTPVGNIYATSVFASVGFGTAAKPIPKIYASNLGFTDKLVDNLYVTTIGTNSAKVSDIYVTNVHGGTFNGLSTSANYADLAERFESDACYEAGTLVDLGGSKEITCTTEVNSTNILGVIAENPAYMMNADAGDNITHPYVALSGRVRTKVIGHVTKGDRIVASDIPGVGIAAYLPDVYSVVGRSLEDKSTDEVGFIWVAVGVK